MATRLEILLIRSKHGYYHHIETQTISHTQKRFNKHPSQTHVCIENAFDSLKGRFRRLFGTLDAKPAYVSDIVLTACVLHNICQTEDNDDDDDQQTGTADVDEYPINNTCQWCR